MASPDNIDRANARGAALRKSGPIAESAHYDRRIGRVVIRLNTGLDVAFSPHAAQGLEDASPADLATIEISPSGLGVHFPKLDADLHLPALLEGFMGARAWMAARLGEKGGRARTAAKAASSRENGKLGGRPKKAIEKMTTAPMPLKSVVVISRMVVMPKHHLPRGLDGRTRDQNTPKAGEIREKRGDTLVGTLRREYGEKFASHFPSNTKLETVRERTGKSLHQLVRNMSKK